MAKAKAPLFSFQARGSVGKVLTFRESARQHVVSTLTDHPDARSAAQLAQRVRYFHAKTYWHVLTAEEKAALLTAARPDNMTGYNLLLRQYLQDALDIALWWPVVEGQGTRLYDYSLNAYNAMNINGVWTTDRCGNPGQALWFDGINDYTWSNTPKLNYTTQSFSVVARSRPENVATGISIVSRGTGNVFGWELRASVTGRLVFYTYQPGAWQQTRSSLGSIVDDTWYTVGFSRAGPTARVYINGVLDSETPVPHIDPTSATVLTRLAIHGDGTSFPFEGKIHDVMVFDRALGNGEHLDIHNHSCIPPL